MCAYVPGHTLDLPPLTSLHPSTQGPAHPPAAGLAQALQLFALPATDVQQPPHQKRVLGAYES